MLAPKAATSWVAAKELKLSYHNMIICGYIVDNEMFSLLRELNLNRLTETQQSPERALGVQAVSGLRAWGQVSKLCIFRGSSLGLRSLWSKGLGFRIQGLGGVIMVQVFE